jgi:hypothetical protein
MSDQMYKWRGTIDRYAEAALGNRQFFLSKPRGIGGRMTKDPKG